MIEVNSLTKEYGANKALDGVSFNINKGEIVGLLGLNGAGKSTTMNILAGCLLPTSGNALINNTDIVKNPKVAKTNIGYLPEIPPLYMDMKVCEYLKYVSELKKVKVDLAPIYQKTGLTEVSGRLIRNLSKGYRQRVGLGGALIGNPQVLIFDEPTVGLDPTQIIEIRNLILSLKDEHTVILSSHILAEIQSVCNRIIIINKGKLVADDTKENLQGKLNTQNSIIAEIEGEEQGVIQLLSQIDGVLEVALIKEGVYKITPKADADVRKAIFYTLSQNNFPLLSSKRESMSLEDVFLALVKKEGTYEGGI